MMRAFKSEAYKLRRRGILLGSFGLIVGLSVLIAVILFATAQPQEQIVADAIDNAGQPRGGGGPGISFETLEKADGFTTAFQFAGSLITIVALVLFAQNVGSEYGLGTLKVLLSHEPRRVRLLSGKLAALATLVVLAVLAAFVVQTLVVIAMAKARGIDMTLWWDAQALLNGALLALRAAAAAIVWGLFGTLLATVFRAAPPAIGIGIAYSLLVETILALVLKDLTKWLPGNALSSFVGWGTSADPSATNLLPPLYAAVVASGYAVAFVAAASILLWRRDVTS